VNPAKELEPRPIAGPALARSAGEQARLFFICLAVLVAAFSPLLWKLARYAAVEETVSHILLVPFICIYLIRIQRTEPQSTINHQPSTTSTAPLSTINPQPSTTPLPTILNPLSSLPLLALGLAALAGWLLWGRTGRMHPNDAFSLSTLSFYCFFVAIALATLGWERLRPYRFALAFFAFVIPLPLFVTNGLSIALQHASAEASDVTLRLTGMPVYRDGLGFQLPNLRIYVAEECSGIRSTLVLFITSVLASHLFLRTRWKKLVFVLCVFPIGVFRNALRITAISWLTVNVDSGIIDSAFHHRGGPIFFVLSLIPLFALLWWFRKSDRRRTAPHPQP
jgi:exosortase